MSRSKKSSSSPASPPHPTPRPTSTNEGDASALEAASDLAALSGLLIRLQFEKDEASFQSSCEEIAFRFAPADVTEVLMINRLIETLRRLRRSSQSEPETPSHTWMRFESLASKEFWKALTELEKHRARKRKEAAAEAKARANAKPEPPPEPPDEDFEDWRERIVIDPRYWPDWPVVKGTDITAEYVCAMLEDEWTFEEIRERFPQLRVSDIRACQLCESEGKCGPWPDGIEPIVPWPLNAKRTDDDTPTKPRPPGRADPNAP